MNLEERGGIIPTLIPAGLGLSMFPSFFPLLLISDISSHNQWTVLLVLLDLVTRMSEQWSHNMNYDHKKWTMITSCHEQCILYNNCSSTITTQPTAVLCENDGNWSSANITNSTTAADVCWVIHTLVSQFDWQTITCITNTNNKYK